jgi:iron(III) transport system ATP-binding protein
LITAIATRPAGRPVSLANVTVRYGTRAALQDVSIDLAAGEMLTLIGASGSGKSTLLRVIAGLERPVRGRVSIDGIEVAGPSTFVEPERRRVGMVFQDYALFPHLTVAANVGYGLRRTDQAEARVRVHELLSRIELADRATAYPHMLSGGERQRVALARALAPAPDVLLLDEPFCSLDASLRAQVRADTFRFLRDAGATVVLVTHDRSDAAEAAGRVAMMQAGQLLAEQLPVHEPSAGVQHVSTV